MPSEAQVRITINKMLEEAGWRFLPDGDGNRENVVLEHRLSGRTFPPSADLGKDFERHLKGSSITYCSTRTVAPSQSSKRNVKVSIH
jgi:hypothetical protein